MQVSNNNKNGVQSIRPSRKLTHTDIIISSELFLRLVQVSSVEFEARIRDCGF